MDLLQFLGISHLAPTPFGHDSAVALLDEESNLFAISEERLSRIKNDGGYPSNSIQLCLNQNNLRLGDIDNVAVGWGLEEKGVGHRINEQFCCYAKDSTNFKRTSIGKKSTHFYDHQYIHARIGYALSGFKKALVISLDGGGIDNGEFNSGGIFIVDNGKISPIKYFPLNVSLGHTYGAITEACGFTMNNGEGKTMTLAPMAENESKSDKEKIYQHMCNVFPDFNGTELRSNGHVTLDGKILHDFLLYSLLDTRLLLLKRLYNRNLIAWAAQKRLEEIVIKIVNSAVDATGIKNLVFSGGIFLNVIMNMKIQQRFGDKLHLFFNPICNDHGNAIGAVLEQYYQETGKNPVSPNMSLYLGSSYSDEEILLSAKRFNFKITKVSKIDTAIDLIGQGKVIGWFQGRSEFGPRGLGNRSILALPTEQKYKDIVNEKVKKREPWRPFCPTIIEEKSNEFLKNPSYAPYMILGFEMKNPELYPAVSHVDGTCRPQILKKDDNPDFYQVVKGLDGIVLNTSFNLAGDPIVETPHHALMTLKNSEMDALLMNDFLIEKCA
uniref:Putative carbamoyl transferase, NodU family n=1 Tax=uncultured marine thaumarchaeote KM3_74_H09 TaxID=1456276 RepID=A0A075HK50_9ARCH|nr:putative carbamoyl transferase, NodU family [uncultured marine thaumarchaeote KM3_74_H09]